MKNNPGYTGTLLGGGICDTPVRSRDMSNFSKDLEKPDRVPPQVGLPAGEDAAKERHHWKGGIPTSGRGDGDIGAGGGG